MNFYGFYGYYFNVKMKVGPIPVHGKICPDHPDYSRGADDKYCAICAEPLVPRTSEDDDINYYEMTQEGAGNLPKRDVKYLENNFMSFGEDADDHYEHLIPQSSKAFGIYLEGDDAHTSKPPKIDGIMVTRTKLKKEIAMLKKHYAKVELKFGFLSDYG